MKNIDKYLETLYIQEDLMILNEIDLLKLVKKLTPDKAKTLTKQIKDKLDEKNPIKSLKAIKGLVSSFPKVKIQAIDAFIGSKMKTYTAMKKTTKMILENSLPKVSKSMQELSATFLVVSSMFDKKGSSRTHKQNLTTQIKTFVSKVRTFGEGFEEEPAKREKLIQREDIPDLAVAWTIVVMTTALATGISAGIYVVMASIPALITANAWFLFYIVIFIIAGVFAVKLVGVGG